VTYCAFWLKDKVSGTAKCTGFGYHKYSQALYEAFKDAGIVIMKNNKEFDFGSAGTEPMKVAMLAVVNALLEYTNLHKIIIDAHA